MLAERREGVYGTIKAMQCFSFFIFSLPFHPRTRYILLHLSGAFFSCRGGIASLKGRPYSVLWKCTLAAYLREIQGCKSIGFINSQRSPCWLFVASWGEPRLLPEALTAP